MLAPCNIACDAIAVHLTRFQPHALHGVIMRRSPVKDWSRAAGSQPGRQQRTIDKANADEIVLPDEGIVFESRQKVRRHGKHQDTGKLAIRLCQRVGHVQHLGAGECRMFYGRDVPTLAAILAVIFEESAAYVLGCIWRKRGGTDSALLVQQGCIQRFAP